MYHFNWRISLYKCYWEHGAPISRVVLSSHLAFLFFLQPLVWFGFPLIERALGHFLIALGAAGVVATYHADNEKWKADQHANERAGR